METEDIKFNPPKLPMLQLGATLVVPAIIAAIPYVFSKDEVTIITCIIIALVLLSSLLFVFSLTIVFKLYDSDFECQAIMLRVNLMRKEIDTLKEETKLSRIRETQEL